MAILSAKGIVELHGKPRQVLMLGTIQRIEEGYSWNVSVAGAPKCSLAAGEVKKRQEALENIELFLSLYGYDLVPGK